MPRVIPATFASQHPDHASVPYWHDSAFISTQQEAEETFLAFKDLEIDEYKWDWEGKLVDESVIERLLSKHYDYFKKHQIGLDKFLTFRLPNPYEETEFRLGRAFMGILSAAALAQKVGVNTPPIFEVILPMTQSARSLIDIQEAFREIAGLKHWMFNIGQSQLQHLEMIPLFEQVNVIMNSDQIIAEYLKLHEEKFGYRPHYLRPYIARSDPSMNSGHVATVLAIKIALSRYQKLSQKLNIPLYPMIGCAALPFRGGLNPYTVAEFTKEYAGIKTVLIQSAFRYDYPLEDAKKAILELKEVLPKSVAVQYSLEDELVAEKFIRVFEKCYRQTIEQVAPIINQIAGEFPARRERVQHVGLFGYSRGVGSVTLPRAIKTTGSLYSIGVPPELFGTGRGLKEITLDSSLDKLSSMYLNLKQDYRRVGGFVNKENIQRLAQNEPFWSDVLQDIKHIEEILGFQLEPKTDQEKEHYKLTTQILDNLLSGKPISDLITKSGILRRSLG